MSEGEFHTHRLDQWISGRKAQDYGKLILSRIDNPIGGIRLRIEHADPVVLIHANIVREILTGPAVNGVSIVNDVLRIEAENQTVVYRLGEYKAPECCYVGRWPD